MNDQYSRFQGERRRGGCLTTYLALLMLGNVLLSCALLTFIGDRRVEPWIVWVSLALQVSSLFFASELWKWKRHGYIGLRTIYILSLIVNFFTGEFSSVIGNLVALVILVALVSEIDHLLER
jgi:hypothetical protein